MFEGSEHHDSGYFQPLQQAGASLNGSTNDGQDELLGGGSHERARAGSVDGIRSDGLPAAGADQAKFDNQRDVVLNERRQNYENRPYGLAVDRWAGALPDGPSVPLADDWSPRRSDAATLEDVREFFRSYYHPANGSLSLAGAVDTEAVLPLVEAYFGDIAPGLEPARLNASAGREHEARVLLEDRVELPRLYLAWHSPAIFASGDAELDLAADVLAGDKSSRLYRRWCTSGGLPPRSLPPRIRASCRASSRWSPPRRRATTWPSWTRQSRTCSASSSRTAPRRRVRAQLCPRGGTLRLPAADRRRIRREVRPAERVQRVSGATGILRPRPPSETERTGESIRDSSRAWLTRARACA